MPRKHLNKNYLACAVIFSLIAFAVYLQFFDILIPGLPNGSYRLAVGQFFAIPAFMLAGGQVLIGGAIIFFAASTFGKAREFEKSLFISSVLVLMFSLTYVLFPMYGPFYYIVFAVGGPPYALALEFLWSISMLAVGTSLVKKLHGTNWRYALVATFITGVFIIVAAS